MNWNTIATVIDTGSTLIVAIGALYFIKRNVVAKKKAAMERDVRATVSFKSEEETEENNKLS